jgi:hypothetical protein
LRWRSSAILHSPIQFGQVLIVHLDQVIENRFADLDEEACHHRVALGDGVGRFRRA